MGCFDLGGAQTYDTRPMPDDGSKLAHVDTLADARAQLELAVPVKDLDRLEPLLASPAGVAEAQLAFWRDRGHVVVKVDAAAALTVLCQRCLAPMVLQVQGGSEVMLVESEEEAAKVPEEFETAQCPEGRMRLRDLVEEELLLALPASPMHEDGECGGTRDESGKPAAAGPTQRPFAALGEMLGRGRGN